MQQWELQHTWASVKAAQLKESVELFRSPDKERERAKLHAAITKHP